MKPDEVANKVFDAIEQHDFNTIDQFTDNSFQFSGPVPGQLNKDQYITFIKSMTTAIPDWKFNRKQTDVKGNTVYFTMNITGTQTGELKLPIPGIPAIPATGKSFKLPEDKIEVTVNNDKVIKIHSPSGPDKGIYAIFAQLGHPINIHL